MNTEKSYVHPKAYAGILNTPTSQAIQRAFVEENCLRREEFCGRTHDFTNCLTTGEKGQRVWICRGWAKGVSLAYPGAEARCHIE